MGRGRYRSEERVELGAWSEVEWRGGMGDYMAYLGGDGDLEGGVLLVENFGCCSEVLVVGVTSSRLG